MTSPLQEAIPAPPGPKGSPHRNEISNLVTKLLESLVRTPWNSCPSSLWGLLQLLQSPPCAHKLSIHKGTKSIQSSVESPA